MNDIVKNTGAGKVHIGSHEVWLYSGSRIVLQPDSILVMPPSPWRVGAPSYPVEYFRDDRQPKTHDNFPRAR